MANIICSICREPLLFPEGEHVISLQCGHVFHDNCVRNWLARNESCPSCRREYTTSTEVRLFFEVEDNNANDDTPAGPELKFKYDSAVHEIRALKEKTATLLIDATKFRTENELLRTELAAKIHESEKIKMSIYKQNTQLQKSDEQRRTQTEIIHSLIKDRDNFQLQLIEARKEIEKLSSVKTLLSDSTSEISGELLNKMDVKTLKLLLSSFKRDVTLAHKNEQQLKRQLQILHNSTKSLDKQKNDLIEKLSLREKVIEVLKEQLKEVNETARSDGTSDDTSMVSGSPQEKPKKSLKRGRKHRESLEKKEAVFEISQSSRDINVQIPSTSGAISSTIIKIEPLRTYCNKSVSVREVSMVNGSLKRQKDINQTSNYDGFGGRSTSLNSTSRTPQLKSGRFVSTQKPLVKRKK